VRGDILLDGVLYEIAGWTREGTNGRPRWLSLAGKRKQERTQAPQQPASKPEASEERPPVETDTGGDADGMNLPF
jgi:hypothetical protein